jgi:hypothetical protein
VLDPYVAAAGRANPHGDLTGVSRCGPITAATTGAQSHGVRAQQQFLGDGHPECSIGGVDRAGVEPP